MVERRRHVDRRARSQAGSQRTITVLGAGGAGVAVKADEVDTTATARILGAVEAAISAGHFRPVATWKEVGEAAKAPPSILVLITHTIPGDDDLGPDLQLGSDVIGAHWVGDQGFLNPGEIEPGPVVIAIGPALPSPRRRGPGPGRERRPRGRHPRLVWNYRSDRFTAFTGDFPPDPSGYSIGAPEEGAEGFVLTLAD